MCTVILLWFSVRLRFENEKLNRENNRHRIPRCTPTKRHGATVTCGTMRTITNVRHTMRFRPNVIFVLFFVRCHRGILIPTFPLIYIGFFSYVCADRQVLYKYIHVFFFKVFFIEVNFLVVFENYFFGLNGFREHTPSAQYRSGKCQTDQRSNITVAQRISEKHTNRKRRETVKFIRALMGNTYV